MMEKVIIDLEYCYGIKKMQHEFVFGDKNGCVIYSSNGTMKTSLAKTLKDISEKKVPKDMLFPDRPSTCSIMTEQAELRPEQIFVIESYNEMYRPQKETLLLANKELRERYEKIHHDIEEKQNELLNQLKRKAGFTSRFEAEFAAAFKKEEKYLLECLVELEQNIIHGEEYTYLFLNDYKYKDLFNDKIDEFIKKPESVQSVDQYMEKYNQLVEKSTYLKKGIFNHTNASAIGKTLSENGFFKADHKVILSGVKEIQSQEALDELIRVEKEQVLADKELRKLFDKIDMVFNKNKEMKGFLKLLEEWPDVINGYKDIGAFKQKVWICYLQDVRELYKQLVELYKQSQLALSDIIMRAASQRTEWEEVIQIFNRRFNVPFKLSISNQEDVILKAASPVVCFTYTDKDEVTVVAREKLISILSMGEKRALYLLNIIFDIEAKKRTGEETLLIVDDIADSFDYKNKYAIIEYLKDNIETEYFKMIVLTHNFDFYRTVGNRLDIGRKHCFMTLKNDDGVQLVKGEYLKNVFDNWKKSIHTQERIFIASIPFVRNLLEYTKGTEDSDYKTLTKLLHKMDDTEQIKVEDVSNIFNRSGINNQELIFPNVSVLGMIYQSANKLENEVIERVNLENKVVLSIAIRLKAEEYMINKINDPVVVRAIKKDQTMKLLKLFKERCAFDEKAIELLEAVMLMTPENIHLNAFMYEPLLDLSDEYLKKLYRDIKQLLDGDCNN